MARSPPIPSGGPKPAAASTRRLARARWRASALALVAAVLWLWSFVTGDPPPLVVIALAMMPWLGMLMARAEAPSRLVGRMRASFLAAVIVPSLALGFVALRMTEAALDWRIPLIAALVVGVPITVLADAAMPQKVWDAILAPALRGSHLARGRALMLLVVFCCMSLYAYGSLSLVNARLDTAPPERFRTAVIGKRITDGRSSTSWYLRLNPWGPQIEPSEAKVPSSLYRSVNVGDGVCVDLRPGALGIAWYIVERCEIGE